MSIAAPLYLLLLLVVCFSPSISAQLVEKEDTDVCSQLKLAREKPLSFWTAKLKAPDPGSRLCATKSLARLGPGANDAVPMLIAAINDRDPTVRNQVYDALVKIADGNDSGRAGYALIHILAESKPLSAPHELALRALVDIYKTRRLLGAVLPGWPDIYPSGTMAMGDFRRPVISSDHKSYSQSAALSSVGNASAWELEETLARNPAFTSKYADESIRAERIQPKVFLAGKRKVLVWNLSENKEQAASWASVNRRIVVLLGNDKVWISEFHGQFAYTTASRDTPWKPTFTNEQLAFFDRAEKALESPPRTDFRRTVALFTYLKKGMSNFDVKLYAGKPDKMFLIAPGSAVAVYELLDGSSVLLRFSNPAVTSRNFSENEDWKLEYANLTDSSGHAVTEFVK
ncbi:MAG: HEAT repeat domain-containing protein [Acidobacteriota bacterium]